MKHVKQLKKGFSLPSESPSDQTREKLIVAVSGISNTCLQSIFKMHSQFKDCNFILGMFTTIFIIINIVIFDFRVDDVGKSIVAAAKEIVITQRMSSKTIQEEDEETKNNFQLRVDSRLKSLEDKIDGLENKIDRILSSITLAGRR